MFKLLKRWRTETIPMTAKMNRQQAKLTDDQASVFMPN